MNATKKGPEARAEGKGPGTAHKMREHPLFSVLVGLVLVSAAVYGAYYWQDMQSKIYLEKAEIRAPLIHLGPSTPRALDRTYVREGDTVFKDQALAKVGGETIRARTDGRIISVLDVPGQTVTPQDPVVTMIDMSKLRLVGRVQEDKGLKDILPGQRVVFTVDAYGNKEYSGTVESVALSARQSDIVFSISDKREEREFEVTAIFNPYAYPELRNGMSARMWIYK